MSRKSSGQPFPWRPRPQTQLTAGICLGQRGPRHTGATGLARAQKHPAHRALHRVSTASVQGLLAPIDRRSRHRSLSYVSRCADMAWWLPSSVSLGWTGCTAAMWAACRGRRNSAHGAAPVPNLAVPGCTQTPCRSAYRESLVRRFKYTVACTASTRSPPAAMA